MKKVLFSIFMIATVAFAFTPTEMTAQAPLLYTGEMGPDTLNNAETVYHYPNGTSFATSRRFTQLGDLEVYVQSDSLTGATAVTYTLQAALDLAGTSWATVDTETGNGATSQVLVFDTDPFDHGFIPTWWRIKATSTGTQTTKFQTTYAFKKRL